MPSFVTLLFLKYLINMNQIKPVTESQKDMKLRFVHETLARFLIFTGWFYGRSFLTKQIFAPIIFIN